MSEKVREDPVKMHKDANSLMADGKFNEAKELFLRIGIQHVYGDAKENKMLFFSVKDKLFLGYQIPRFKCEAFL